MTDSELHLRPATDEDVEWLLELRMTTMAGYFEQAGYTLSRDDQRARLMQAFEAVSIVRFRGNDAGMMKVVREADVWHLVQIQLLPAYQSQHIGRRLIKALVQDAREAGVPVSLHVLKVNPAKRLYDRLGFEVVADLEDSYEMRTALPARTVEPSQ